MKQDFSRHEIDAPDAPRTTHRRYSQGIEIRNVSRTLYISGQIPVEADGARPSDFKAQARLAWRNVERQLAAAGMSLDDLVKVTVFLASYEYRDENAEVRFEIMGDRMVALSTVIAGPYDPAWLIEIEAIAAA
ncbi:RidA family protein [Mesorhizobium sp. YR577]|uniref:RidA family protein n=1 Tax=Mesorhizobium sp. YR577 TaxID=1884373 RepID=UPI0008F36082|nr:RidA family protein [Mesorhizobium sp. YR577]SFU11747.1 Enamine deaminase RidA, house cleaning of reactive enamine intermediates, YjgF/YER057c/UK114 family [Mesorhizobium sp. YR577]